MHARRVIDTKIGYVYDVIYPYVKGGAQKRVWEIARRLARNHEVHLFGMKYWNGVNDIVRDGVYLHGVCEPKELYINGRRSIKEALYFASRVFYPLLKEDLDIIDCQEAPFFPSFSAKLYSLARKNSLVITWYEVWGDYWYEYLGAKGFLGMITEKLTVKLPKIVIPISERIKEDLQMLGVPEERMKVVPNGVDFQRIQKIKPSSEEFDVIYVGRLMKHKRVDVLLRALSIIKEEIHDFSFAVIGDGPEMSKLRNLSEILDLKNNVQFFGFVETDDEVYSYMKSSKIFVLPSTREGFPNTILEAHACHLPAITVNQENNAAVDLVENGFNGYVLNLSPKELAEKITYLLQNRTKLKELSKNCIDLAKQHDWKRIVREIEEVYNMVVR